MIKLKIISNRSLCQTSLDITVEKIFYNYLLSRKNLKKDDQVNFNKKIVFKNDDFSSKNILKDSKIIDFLKDFEIDSIVLREKDLSESSYKSLYKNILKISSKYNIDLFAHSYYKDALYMEGGKIHLPLYIFEEICEKIDSEEKDNKSLDKFFKCYKEIGVSVHSIDEAKRAESLGASYLTFGHIFETDCKKGLEPRGLKLLRELCSSVEIPIYAIGGITPQNAYLAVENGAKGVCIMSGIMKL